VAIAVATERQVSTPVLRDPFDHGHSDCFTDQWPRHASGISTVRIEGKRVSETVTQSVRRLPDDWKKADKHAGEPSGLANGALHRLPTDDVISQHPDRQVLVVGDTVVGYTLTLLLGRAGYDPLLVSGTGSHAASRVTYLSSPAVQVLNAIGLRQPLRERGVHIESISVQSYTGEHSESAILVPDGLPAERRPVVVETQQLRSILKQRLPDRQVRVGRSVDTLSQQDAGLAVEFSDGIREWFDMVVGVSGWGTSLRPAGREPPTEEPLLQQEAPIEIDGRSENELRDIWHPDALVQYTPWPNEKGGLLRVTAVPSVLEKGQNAETTGASDPGGMLADELEALPLERIETEPSAVRQVSLHDDVVQRDWWGTDRVSFCGPAACPTAPASGFAVSSGIEDAVAFVKNLSGDVRPVADVVDAYVSSRDRRLRTLRQATEEARPDYEYPFPKSAQSVLGSVGTFRQLALEPFLGGPAGSIQGEEDS
jgi:2-polyprenyl-6-methoxyphenol hydroxylase-like FAD-dependent oxidoreductase